MPIMNGTEWLKGYMYGAFDEQVAVEKIRDRKYRLYPLGEAAAKVIAEEIDKDDRFDAIHHEMENKSHSQDWFIEVDWLE